MHFRHFGWQPAQPISTQRFKKKKKIARSNHSRVSRRGVTSSIKHTDGKHLHAWHRQVGSTESLGCKRGCRGAVALLSPPLFSLTHYPGGSVLGSSVPSPAAANKPTGEINQRGGGPVSAGATNAHLFKISKKSGSRIKGQTFLENLCFCVSVEVTVQKKKKTTQNSGWGREGAGAVRKPTTWPETEQWENKSKESKAAAAALIGSPLIWSTVQGYRLSYCKNLNKSEGKRQSWHCSMTLACQILVQAPEWLCHVNNKHTRKREREGQEEKGGGGDRAGSEKLCLRDRIPNTDLLHQSFQLVSVLPEAPLNPVEHLGVELAIAGQSQAVL